jgi:histidinol-phosphate/aromatic aminotransferase/cobyric acid decarboxylase-like protein
VRFPLVDWIEAHPGLRHDLSPSGMAGTIRRPELSARERRATDPGELRRALAASVHVAPDRLFLTHGATEANAWVVHYVARSNRGRAASCRVRYPEYPPLFEGARAAGFRLREGPGPSELALLSQPRNPEGDEWATERLLEWAAEARHLLVDETFREFGERASWATVSRPRIRATGTFTKYFAGDDLRVGFVVAPDEERAGFGRFHGLFSDLIAPASVAGALSALRHRRAIGRDIEQCLGTNRRALVRAFPGVSAPVAPVWFDRTGPGSDRLADRLLRRSVLVCPGRFFGDPGGVRLTLTRRSFPADLVAYRRGRGSGTDRGATAARSPRGASARARAGRG